LQQPSHLTIQGAQLSVETLDTHHRVQKSHGLNGSELDLGLLVVEQRRDGVQNDVQVETLLREGQERQHGERQNLLPHAPTVMREVREQRAQNLVRSQCMHHLHDDLGVGLPNQRFVVPHLLLKLRH
jgi:hypothetical protein